MTTTTPTRASLIPRILAPLGPGDRMTAGEVAQGLLHAGHDFGGIVTAPDGDGPDAETMDRLVVLTARALDRLVERGEVADGEPLGDLRTWRPVTPDPTDDPPPPPPTRSETPGSVTAAAFLIAQAVLGVLILLIGTVRGW